MNAYVAMVEWHWQGKTEVLAEKPVPVPLCAPQIPHGSCPAPIKVDQGSCTTGPRNIMADLQSGKAMF
jgi:hypothetical protein